MAHSHGDAGNPNTRYPTMDTLANVPFDHMMNHINAIHNHAMQINQQLQLPFQPPIPLMHPSPFPQIQHHMSPFPMQQFHNPFATHQSIMQHAMAQMNEVTMMHNNMLTAINNMFGMPMQFQTIDHQGQAMHHHTQYEELAHLDESVKRRGVSHSDLSKLKRVRFSSRDKCKQCGICQEYFAVGMQVLALPCTHIYCEEEILKWFEQNKTCPTCRHVVENVGVY